MPNKFRKTINVHFKHFTDACLIELHKADGVYVISSNESEKISYIGMGRILDRLIVHAKSYKKKWAGCYAIIENEQNLSKSIASGIEDILITICQMHGQMPKKNKADGCDKFFLENLNKNENIKIIIRGHNPLSTTHELLRKPVTISLKKLSDTYSLTGFEKLTPSHWSLDEKYFRKTN